MKIALVRREFRPHRGGAERYARMLAEGLRDAGHEVHLFSGRVDETLPEGIHYHPVSNLEFWSPVRHWWFDHHAARALRPHDFDIVQALEPHSPYDVYQAGDGLHAHVFTIPEAHSGHLTPQHHVKTWIERRALQPDRYCRITVPSRMMARQATRLYRFPARLIDVIEPPVDFERFTNLPRPHETDRPESWNLRPDSVVCCFAGLDYRRKGLPLLIEAFRRLDDRFHLLVAGKDRRASTFHRQAEASGIGARAHFVGRTDGIEGILSLSDVLVHPALYEPFGLVVTEAMASGRPVVTTRATGAADWIEPGKNGLVLESARDADELARALRALADPHVREQLGRAAAETVKPHTLASHIQRTIAVYEEVRAHRAGPPRRAHALPARRLGSLEAENEFALALEKAEIDDFAGLAALPSLRTLHALKPERRIDLVRVGEQRVVRKLYLDDPHGGGQEWRALQQLAEEGLLGPTPLAHATDGRGSTVLMGWIRGEKQLDHWSAQVWRRLPRRERARRKREIIDALADDVRAFHEKGFSHRDLYLCHVWIREEPELQLRFMDLHRVEQHARLPRRLRVKDLAAIHFSAVRWVGPNLTDQLRFFRRYLDVPRLRPKDLRLARAVLRKSARIEHHNRNNPVV